VSACARHVALAALLVAGCAEAPPSARDASLLAPCTSAEAPADALCGQVEVWENRAASEGRRVALKIVVLPALSREPRADPLFVLAGGPGQAATEIAGALAALLTRVQEERDVVLVDQRGTGGSSPLDCDLPEDLDAQADPVGASLARLRECLAGYEADTRLYTTPIAMDDLDDVRSALGYDRINLWGGSYGTRAALVYMRRHPDRARSAVLDGVAPPDMKLPLSFAADGQRALDRLLEACEEDPDCRGTFPALGERITRLLERLEEQPAELSLEDPHTGAPEEVRIDRDTLASLLRNALYSPTVSSLLPLLLERADAGDYRGLAALASLAGEVPSNLSLGMMLSVLCTEDVALIAEPEAAAATARTFLKRAALDRFQESCSFWPRGELPPGYHDPVASEVPVLVLSGELDPATPPRWGAAVAEHLPNAHHVVVPAAGHGTSTLGCVPRLIGRFLDAGSAADLDASCVEEIRRSPFFLTPSGPLPEAEP